MLKKQPFYLTTILIILFIQVVACKQKPKPVKLIEKKYSNNNYVDAIADSNLIWGLTADGSISLFNADSGNYINKIVKNDSIILFLAKDKKGVIIIGDNSNSLKQYNKSTNSFETILKCPNNIFGVSFDSKNNYYLLTNRGIFDANANKTFYPDSSFSLNSQIRLKGGWLEKPVFLVDKKDNIWLGFGYGEWGGDLVIFNTVEKKFIKPNLNNFRISLNPVKSIFEDNKSVYVSCGLMHFSTSGEIVRFDEFKAKPILKSTEHRERTPDDKSDTIVNGEYIGPATYNKMDNCIYMYTQHGVFKGEVDKDLSKIEYWTSVLDPKLHWSNGQPDAVGSPMNVLKLTFIESGKLLFVSQNDGIGLYDDGQLIMMQ